jgi:hypothetical protein
MTRPDARHEAKRKVKPCQVSPVLPIIAWTTFGPMIDDARFVIPKRLKNCIDSLESQRGNAYVTVTAICGQHVPYIQTLVETAPPSPFGSMKNMVLGMHQRQRCAPRTPTLCDIFGWKRYVLYQGIDERLHDPPKFVCPDSNHSPKREQNRHDDCRDELNSIINNWFS